MAAFLTVGYMVGNEWHRVIPVVESYLWAVVAGFIGLGLAAYLVYRLWLARRQTENQTRDDEGF